MQSSINTVSFDDVKAAQARIKDYVFHTPTYPNLSLSRQTGAHIFLKLECYQPTGVFKIRGAFNIELENLEKVREKGVVTASSGNHGLSVAYASRVLGVKCTVVITKGANPEKVKLIKLNGASIVEGGPNVDSIVATAREISKQSGHFFVHPFDDAAVIAGQGTCGLEMCEDVKDLDTIIVPVGGGGLISGISIAARALSPKCKIIGVEATGVPSLYESIKKKELVTITNPTTIADGLIGQTIGRANFEICMKNVSDVVLVSDDAMKQAVKTLLFDSHILVEPSGAAPVAALLTGEYRPAEGEKLALVTSGGNIAYTLLRDLLDEAYPRRS